MMNQYHTEETAMTVGWFAINIMDDLVAISDLESEFRLSFALLALFISLLGFLTRHVESAPEGFGLMRVEALVRDGILRDFEPLLDERRPTHTRAC
jgi:hypothetical protein